MSQGTVCTTRKLIRYGKDKVCADSDNRSMSLINFSFLTLFCTIDVGTVPIRYPGLVYDRNRKLEHGRSWHESQKVSLEQVDT